MRKLLLCLLILLLALPVVFAETAVKHSAENGQVHVFILPDKDTKMLDLGELTPVNCAVKSWTISGLEKSNVAFESSNGKFMGNSYSINHWKFSKLENQIELVYSISCGKEITSVWFYPSGFSMATFAINK